MLWMIVHLVHVITWSFEGIFASLAEFERDLISGIFHLLLSKYTSAAWLYSNFAA